MPTLEELAQQLLSDQQQAPVLPQLPRQSRDDGGGGGWTGLLGDVGEVLSGGQSPTYRLRGSERAAAGSRALLNFGINMMMASGPQRVRPDLFTGFASGLQGAQQSMDLDQRRAQAVAQQDYTQRMELAKLGVEQSRDKIERLKALIPLLQLQQRGQPLPGDTSATGGTTTAGAPGGGYGQLLTGDIEHDEPIIRQRESEGNPKALNYVARADPEARKRGATASGLYGFVDSTWKEGLAMVGGDAAKYPTADSAPESVQREVFRAVYKARGTAPWDSRTWGQNWVQNPQTGKYELVATPKGTAARTGGTDVAGPPGTVPARTPPPVATTAAQPPPATAPAAPVAVEPETRLPVAASPGAAPAQQPPAPAPDASLPPGAPKWDAFFEQHRQKPTAEEEATFNTPLAPESEAQLKAALDAAREQERIARELARRGEATGGGQVEQAKVQVANRLAEIEKARREALAVGKKLRAEWLAKEKDRVKSLYDEVLKGGIAETKSQADHRRALELKEAEQEGQFVMDQKKKFGDSQQGAYDQLDSLQTLRQLSDAIPGQATLSPQVRDLLVRFGFTPEGLNSESARVQAFESALSRTVVELRKGVQMGQLSDRDLSFIQNMGPQAMQNPETRAAIIGHLITAGSRKAQYIERVQELYGGGKAAGGMAWSDAVKQARKEIPEFVVPTLPRELLPGYRPPGRDRSTPGPAVDNTEARKAWIAEHVPRGGLVRLPDGSMRPVSLGD